MVRTGRHRTPHRNRRGTNKEAGHFGLLVPNLIALRKRLSLNGCTIEEALPISKHDRFNVRDLFGNRTEFMAFPKSAESPETMSDAALRLKAVTYPLTSAWKKYGSHG